MKPGVTVLPVASMTVAASAVTSPIWTIRSPRTPTSARRAAAPVPSTTEPPRITTSSTWPLLPHCHQRRRRGLWILRPLLLVDVCPGRRLHRRVPAVPQLLGGRPLLVGAGLDPVGPMLPPRALAGLRLGQPGVGIGSGLGAGEHLHLGVARRIHQAL